MIKNLTPPMRTIKSFVCRNKKLTPLLEATVNQWESFYCVPLEPKPNISLPLDLDSLFKRSAPRVLEIGFGDGECLAQMASQSPYMDFLGIETYVKGKALLLQSCRKMQLTNVRILQGDAVEILQNKIPHKSLNRVHIFFSDPWPKTRHKKRRLIQPEFLTLLAEKMCDQGILHLATDCDDYAKYMMKVLTAHQQFRNCVGGGQYSDRGARPMTKYERRGLRLGNAAKDLLFECQPLDSDLESAL